MKHLLLGTNSTHLVLEKILIAQLSNSTVLFSKPKVAPTPKTTAHKNHPKKI